MAAGSLLVEGQKAGGFSACFIGRGSSPERLMGPDWGKEGEEALALECQTVRRKC